MRVTGAFLLAATMMTGQTRRAPATEVFHGVEVKEDYRWLEDADSEETRRWVVEQNGKTGAWLKGVERERAAWRSLVERLQGYDRMPSYSTESGTRAGYFVRMGREFYLRQSGLQNQAVLFVREGGRERVLLDPNTLSADGTAALNTFSVSRDGRHLAYAIAKAGSDWVEWRVRQVETGRDLMERLEWSKFSSAEWDARGQGFYYGRFPAPAAGSALQAVNENYQLCYHKLGTAQSADRVVYERPDAPRLSFSATVSGDGRWLVVTVENGTAVEKQLHYVELTKAGARVTPLVGEFYAAMQFLGSVGTKFYVLTNYEAPRYRIVEMDLARPERGAWRTVVAEGQDAIKQAQMVGGRFVVSTMRDVSGRVVVHEEGKAAREVGLPANSSITLGEDSDEVFAVAGVTRPETVVRCVGGRCAAVMETKLPFAAGDYETRQVFAKSKDGTRVPMYVTHKKGLILDGSHAALLYAYGGFNIPVTPAFSVFQMAWLERGGVYATANLRGGNEYGESWHRAGMKQNKQNVFDDFIAAAEWLIENKYTAARRLGMRGGSNGGLLVGAVLNQRPELFGAAVPAVGVMDMLRFDRFTIGHAWATEYGSPANVEDFKAIYKYSPLHNIRVGGEYPATLVLTADHDDRVVPAHSFKYAAALQAAQKGEAPVLIRIETAAGHGAGKPTSKVLDEAADVLAFLEKSLGGLR